MRVQPPPSAATASSILPRPRSATMRSGFSAPPTAHSAWGSVVSDAGNVNGDQAGGNEIGDFIVSELGANQEGITYVVFGKNAAAGSFGDVDLGTLPSTGFFSITGASGDAASTLGSNATFAASAGDVNGDGYDDVIVGLPGEDTNGPSAGAAWVIFGSATPSNITSAFTTGDATASRFSAKRSSTSSGFSVSGAGDVNGDGFADIIVGSPGCQESFVIFGFDTDPIGDQAQDIDLSVAGARRQRRFAISSAKPDGPAGLRRTSHAGDVNADGYDEVIHLCAERRPDGRSERGRQLRGLRQARQFCAEIDVADLASASAASSSMGKTTTTAPVVGLRRRRFQQRRVRRPRHRVRRPRRLRMASAMAGAPTSSSARRPRRCSTSISTGPVSILQLRSMRTVLRW